MLRCFILTFLFHALFLCMSLLQAETSSPNVIVILADDLGYGDIGSYGAKLIKTPNLDKMAEQGVHLTNFYAAANVCTPSRASLLTGRYAIRMGLANKTIEEGDKRGLPLSEVTLAEELQKKGYDTAIIGKWHLGHAEAEFWPTKHGFDYYYGLLHPNEHKQPLYRNHSVIEAHPIDQKTLTLRYTSETLNFIRDSHKKEKPFFIFLSHTFPHIPLYASAKFENKSEAGRYGDTVEELDWSTGQLLDELKKLGIDEETLLIFTSDNGPFPEGSTGGLRGGKGTPWDGGYRVPFISRWPGVIPENVVSTAISMNIDIFPTVLSIAGIETRKDLLIDGKNISALLKGENKSPHEVLYFFNNERIAALRHQRWRLVLSDYPPWRDALPFLFEKTPNRRPLLFDMDTDMGERFDMSRDKQNVMNRLSLLLKKGRTELETLSSFTDEEMYQLDKIN
jgi:arylsulfatase A